MKKMSIFLLSTLLLLTSCAPSQKEDEIVQKKDEQDEQEISIVPNYQLSKENYKMVLPFRPSEARGVIVDQISNRLDIYEVEDGLRRHSTEAFDPEKYYFEEGQYLTKDMVYDWLGRHPTKEQLKKQVNEEVDQRKEDGRSVDKDEIEESLKKGLNPKVEDDTDEDELRDKPRYLSHIVEQNFLERTDDDSVELVGVSIGLALKSVYKFKADPDGDDLYEDISKREMLKEGKAIAQKVVKRMRDIEGLENIPIMIGLYREEEQSSPVPGNFVAKTNVAGDASEIGKWESLDEEYVLFPSDNAKEEYFDDYELVNSFGEDISEYFPNYVGVVGEGFYINEDLKKLTIEVPLEFFGRGEVVGFTQYTYGVVKETFPNHYDIEIKVMSSDQMESLIYREAGEDDPEVHILH